MPRRPSVRYFKSRKAYYCQIDGVQNHLATGPDDYPDGPTYKAAANRFAELISQAYVEDAGDSNTVRVILETYMQEKGSTLAPGTQRRRVEILRPFADALGEGSVRDLSLMRINAFIRAQREPREHERTTKKGKKVRFITSWSDATVSTFRTVAFAVFNWAIEAKLVSSNPFAQVDDPGIRSRSRDCLLTPEQHAQAVQACRYGGMRRLLVALENTGARPGELTAARGVNWNDKLGAIIYHGDKRRRKDEFRHKTAGKEKDRVIYFTGPTLAYLRERAKLGPDVILFPNKNGRPFDHNSVKSGINLIAKRLGLPGFSAVSYRHMFATNWLKAGKSIEILAELLGDTPETIRDHYAHLCSDLEGIRRHLEAFRAEGERS